MNKVKRLVGGAMISLMAISQSSAWAACTQADMTGLWHVYTTAVTNSGYIWAHCRVRIDGTGKATAPFCVFSNGQKAPLVNASIKIDKPAFCVFKGSFNVGPLKQTVRHITLASDKKTAKGVGTSPAGAFTVDLLKL